MHLSSACLNFVSTTKIITVNWKEKGPKSQRVYAHYVKSDKTTGH